MNDFGKLMAEIEKTKRMNRVAFALGILGVALSLLSIALRLLGVGVRP